MDTLRNAGGFPPEQQHVAAPIRMVEIGLLAPGGEHQQPTAVIAPPTFEVVPAGMAHDGDRVQIIHPGTTEGAVADWKTCGLDDVRLDAQTGCKTQNRAGVLG